MVITVIGSGVIGLTSAVRLAEEGAEVEVITREPLLDTTSVRAGAVWTVTEVEPISRTIHWALASRERFSRIAAEPDSGVGSLQMVELHHQAPGSSPWLETPWVRAAGPAELPAGYLNGWVVDGFRIEPPTYLVWLARRLHRLGGRIELQPEGLSSLEDAKGSVVINCSGLGARDLAGDRSVTPIRGQVVAVANPGIDRALADETDPDRIAYLYPHPHEVVLGGTRQVDRWDTDPDPAETERIRADTAKLEPRLANVPLREVRVGLRPGRPEVRLEADRLSDGRTVVHNYGHAGSGFTLSWGCADEVAALLEAVG